MEIIIITCSISSTGTSCSICQSNSSSSSTFNNCSLPPKNNKYKFLLLLGCDSKWGPLCQELVATSHWPYFFMMNVKLMMYMVNKGHSHLKAESFITSWGRCRSPGRTSISGLNGALDRVDLLDSNEVIIPRFSKCWPAFLLGTYTVIVPTKHHIIQQWSHSRTILTIL